MNITDIARMLSYGNCICYEQIVYLPLPPPPLLTYTHILVDHYHINPLKLDCSRSRFCVSDLVRGIILQFSQLTALHFLERVHRFRKSIYDKVDLRWLTYSHADRLRNNVAQVRYPDFFGFRFHKATGKEGARCGRHEMNLLGALSCVHEASA